MTFYLVFGPGADELLHLLIAIINSFLEKEFHDKCCLDGRFFNKELLTW